MAISTQFSGRCSISIFACLAASIFAVGVIAFLSVTCVFAQIPTTQPAATQTSAGGRDGNPVAKAVMRLWFDRLADPDPKVRDQARIDLMGFPAGDLPKLRQLVIDRQPLRSTQAAVLHDIVVQMYLSDDKYEIISDEMAAGNLQSRYFLGVRWPSEEEFKNSWRLGVTIEERLPGFPSFRYLRTGDMVMGVYLDPSLPLDRAPNGETHFPASLISTIKGEPNMQDIVLLVLRDGEEMRIAIKMAPRPAVPQSDNRSLEQFASDRSHRADAYWQEQFAPLLDRRYVGEPAVAPATP